MVVVDKGNYDFFCSKKEFTVRKPLIFEPAHLCFFLKQPGLWRCLSFGAMFQFHSSWLPKHPNLAWYFLVTLHNTASGINTYHKMGKSYSFSRKMKFNWHIFLPRNLYSESIIWVHTLSWQHPIRSELGCKRVKTWQSLNLPKYVLPFHNGKTIMWKSFGQCRFFCIAWKLIVR